MYSTRTAYLLWLIGGFGVLGLHRFYLGKPVSGLLYVLTGGLGGLGSLYDLVTMKSQVREARLKSRMRRALDDRLDELDDGEFSRPRAIPQLSHEGESPEHVILRVAKANHGIASAAQVALDGKISTDEAREQLDKLVDKGIGEVRVRKSGSLAYVFPDFLDETGRADLEAF